LAKSSNWRTSFLIKQFCIEAVLIEDAMNNSMYDVVIIGGGVTGTALLYSLAKFTDLKRVALIEKYDSIAAVNSKATNNSQTLHCGDIETNYSLEKAISVQRNAQMVARYGAELPAAEREQVMAKFPKMVLGVGAAECQLLRDRYAIFRPHFPGMQLLDKQQVAAVEPAVVRGPNGDRPEEIAAIAVLDEYTAVNYGALAQSFVKHALTVPDKTIDLKLGTPVTTIVPVGENYQITTPKETLTARFVVVSAGGHSLLFAHQMGYGLEYSCLPVAGSFYFTPPVLNGKVYTIQNDILPFAAIHGDPDLVVPGKTRFGPTALPLPLLERYNPNTFADYMQVLRLDGAVMEVFWDLLKVADIRNYILKNIGFEIPIVNRRMFLKDARKIVPTLRLEDLSFAKGFGGVRPQLIDKNKRQLILGQATIDPGHGIRFNITPSPGATNCLGNAEQDLLRIQAHLGCQFDRSWFDGGVRV
jgi:malate dehydrogenase (quinone)